MPIVTLRGVTAEQLRAGLIRLPRVLSGREPDPTGAVRGLVLSMGQTLLGKVKDNFVVQAAGGEGELGTGPWPKLSPATLLLRRWNASPKALKRIEERTRKLPRAERDSLRRRARELEAVIRGQGLGRRERRRALSLLERRRRRGTVSASQYKTLRSLLAGRPTAKRIAAVALAAASAEILRDSGRLLNSLSPGVGGGDQVLKVEPGALVVGTTIAYAKYHQSNRPRKQRKDGSGPVLPRRQFLPDDDTPIPPSWWKAMTQTLSVGLTSPEFWRLYLTGR